MSLGCARCGACCERIFTSLRRGTLTSLLANPYLAGVLRRQAVFIDEHWHAVGVAVGGDTRWECDVYDPVHQLCTRHDERPPVCRGYPWYSQGMTQARITKVHKQCSYLLDVPPADRQEGSYPLIPLEVL